MKGFKFVSALLLAANALIANAQVTFKVVAVSNTPYVVVNNKKYAMKVEQYPVYSVTLNVNAPVKYHYVLGSEEETFTRVAESETTLNEFFNRKITVKKHPLLPKAFETFATLKKSKLYDDTHISTVLVEANQSEINNIHAKPNQSIKVKAKVTYVSPYSVKVFNNASISISGQSTVYNKKLSYKLSGLKTDDDKELYSRSSVKLRAEYVDASFIREKTYFDMLNAIGVPTSQSKYTRVFINKKPIGLFLMTDDFDNKHFLKSTFNNGKKFTVDNAIFKVDAYDGYYGDLAYHGSSSDHYKIYTYKGDEENANSSAKVKEILVPFLYDISKYPTTQKLNLDINAFIQSIALEFLAYGPDNFWMTPSNYFLFKDMAKNQWYFLDSDFDLTFGHGDPSKVVSTTVDTYAKANTKISSSRPLIDNIRKVAANDKYLKNSIKRIIKTVFNINAIGPRIDSFAEMLLEDALWDFKLARMNTYTGRTLTTYTFTKSDFQTQIGSTTSTVYPRPIKKWIIDRSQKVAAQLGFTIPTTPSTSLGYFEPEYEGEASKNSYVDPGTSSPAEPSLPYSDGQCGPNIAICKPGLCCSKYGYCGSTSEYCGTGCQSEFGQCNTTPKTTTTTTKKATTTKSSLPTSDDRCGPNIAVCAPGLCCSKYGYCDNTPEHCGAGCQSEFGQCNTTAKTTTTTIKKTTTTTTKKATTTSTNTGKCGSSYGKCASGYCCSKYGYCGKTTDYCGTGCQSAFGKCN